jgi:hypothetical protein
MTLKRIAFRVTATSRNFASPTLNTCDSPTTWRCPFVRITAAVGAAGLPCTSLRTAAFEWRARTA